MIALLLLTSSTAVAELSEEFQLRLQQACVTIEQDDPGFYQTACTFAETSQTRYQLIIAILDALETGDIKPFDAACLLNIAKSSLEWAYMALSRIRYGLGG